MLRVLPLVWMIACGSKSEPPGAEPASGSPTEVTMGSGKPGGTAGVFVRRGTPTLVFGTAGDERSDQATRAQVALMRLLAWPAAKVIADTELAGKPEWSPNPILYGGAHVNAAIAAIAKDLPFEITANKLVIGGQTFEGDGLALITVVPARAGKYPEFLLYAGTGTPGVTEINAGTGADAPIVIADAFGPWITGIWKIDDAGVATAQLGPPARRVAWRETKRTLRGAEITFKVFEGTADRDTPMIAQAEAGIATALDKLAPARGDRPVAFTVVIHPDLRSKKSLTGNGGTGHAVGFANTLHVFAHQGLAYLTTHEATHSILFLIWPPAGSQLLGEGTAVWTTGGYAGQPIASFRGKLKVSPIKELLAKDVRTVPEGELYPLGGTVVEAVVQQVGLAKFRDHLYGANPATWDDACKAAGTTAEALDAAFAAAVK
jgi:hypothetical protein